MVYFLILMTLSILRDGVVFCLRFLHNTLMNILQKIFKEHYEEIEYTLHPRPIVMENVAKMIYCGDPPYGGAMYGCSHCGELKFVPFRCHSKFFPTCGNKYCIDRSTNMSFKLMIVLTDTLFLPLMKIYALSFSMTVPCLTAFFRLFAVSFSECSMN